MLNRFSIIVLFYGVVFLLPQSVLAKDNGNWPMEEQRIEALLATLLEQDAIFIRNGSEYQAQEAVEHLNRKLNNAMRSWFAPPKREWTAEMFIDKLATKSSLSGKAYLIRFADGSELASGLWLHRQLSLLNQSE